MIDAGVRMGSNVIMTVYPYGRADVMPLVFIDDRFTVCPVMKYQAWSRSVIP
jgi:hypothetical protein